MQHSRTVARPSVRRPNLDGGKPVSQAILHLEGHVEEICALSDDVQVLRHLSHVQEQLARVAARIAGEATQRAARLEVAIIPEVQRCYGAGEALVSQMATA